MSNEVNEGAVTPSPLTVAAQIASRKSNEETLFTAEQQAEVNRIVQERVQRVEAKYADYDDIRASADRSSALEARIGELQQEMARVQLEALRVSVAARFGLSDADRDVLLTGTDEASLIMQAERLSAQSARRTNVAPREGNAVRGDSGPADRDVREFVQDLFGSDPYWDQAGME